MVWVKPCPGRYRAPAGGCWDEVLGTQGQPVGWSEHRVGQLVLAEPTWHIVGMGRNQEGGEHLFSAAP